MKPSMTARLVVKDLAFNRPFIIGGTLAGLATLFIMDASELVGMIMFVTIIVVCGVFLGIVNVTRERAEKSALFVLSLPVSTLQYTVAKVLAAVISFLVPWTALLVTVIVLVRLDPASTANLPFFTSFMTLLLTNFFILVTVGVLTTSERWVAGAIILTNTSVPLFFASESPGGPAVWTSGMLAGLAAEAAIVLLCIGLMFYAQTRRKDFV